VDEMSNIGARNTNVDGQIRRATAVDIPAIARLMLRAQARDGIPRIAELEIGALMTCGEILVLGIEPPELVAAACLTRGTPHLAFLVVDPAVPGLAARIGRALSRAAS
jgi:hypothetical protein